jgi:IPT/TIG domain
MSQDNPTPEERQQKNKETRNRMMLGALLLLLLVVIYYQFFSSGDTQKTSSEAPSANAKATPTPTPQRQTSGTPAPIISEPLDLASIQGGSHSSGGTGRNIFIYPTPTPPPPPPPPTPVITPTPWPVPVSSLNPGGVIARTAGFTLTVFGQKMPQDAQGFVNGSAYPTTFVNDTQVRINVPAEAIRMPGILNVTVRSQSNTALFSNPIPLNVAAPPEPPYKYIGLITLKNVPRAVLVSQGNDDDVYNVKKGDVVGGKWKIVNITPQKVEIEDTSIKVSHVINYTVDTK